MSFNTVGGVKVTETGADLGVLSVYLWFPRKSDP